MTWQRHQDTSHCWSRLFSKLTFAHIYALDVYIDVTILVARQAIITFLIAGFTDPFCARTEGE